MATTITTGYTWVGGETITAAKLNNAINNAVLSGISDSDLSAITTASKVNGSALYSLGSIPSGGGTIPAANLPSITGGVALIVDGGGSAITTGIKGDILIPFAATITGIFLLADQSTTTTIDIWKTTYTLFDNSAHPVAGDTVRGTTGTAITIPTAQKYTDTTLTNWTGTAITANDVLRFNVNANDNAQKLNIVIKYTKTVA